MPSRSTSSPGGKADGAARGWKRHLDGWQPGLVAVFLAGSAALLAVPRPVAPLELPPPRTDPSALAEAFEADDARAEEAARAGLDFDVREVGSAMRDYGRADHDQDEVRLARAKEQVGHAAGKGAVTPAALLMLRAYQQRSFLREVRRWEATGEESDELIELGGGFTRMLARSGWCEGPGCRRVKMDEATRRASFKKRWNEITGQTGAELSLSREEQKALIGFLLAHPIDRRTAVGPTPPALATAARRTLEDQFRLQKLDDLAAVDPSYPADFARGVVLFRLGRYPLAVEAFRRHLDRTPDGPLALRAQNHLRAALDRAGDGDVVE